MDFDLSADQREIQNTARELLSARCAPAAVRAAAESRGRDAALWQEVSGLGWPGIAIAEQDGGQGLGMVELCVLLEQAGAALAPIPLLPSAGAALMISHAGSPEQRGRWLPALADGSATGAVGTRGREGCLVAGEVDADVFVIFDDATGAQLLEREQAHASPLPSIDPLRGYALLDGTGGQPLPGDAQAAALMVAIAVAAESVGVCQRALEMTIAYVKERKQFDTPVGAFQAVSHRCAEMLLHTERARSVLYHAAWACDAEPQLLAQTASLAKALSCEAAIAVTASAIQAHGGIGFTWEADVHWLYKRAQMNAQLMGGAAEHRRRLAQVLEIAPTG
jgi:alkylation response protein AidB-like acyl-CoA dehydrogenase